MTITSSRALRAPAIAALAVTGILGLAGCAGGDDDAAVSAPAASEESSAPETSAAEESPSASTESDVDAVEAEKCSEAQVAAIAGGTGTTTISGDQYAVADGAFRPGGALGGQTPTCAFGYVAGESYTSIAILPGGAATVSAMVAGSNGALTETSGTAQGTVDGAQVVAAPLSVVVTGDTSAFENPEDAIIVVAYKL